MDADLSREELSVLTRRRLLELARARRLKGCSRLRKQELIERLSAAIQPQPLSEPQPAAPQREPEGAKFYLGPDITDWRAGNELPSAYGGTAVKVMVRDPYWLYAYWEINPQSLLCAQEKLQFPWQSCRRVLRVYDVTGIDFDGANANGWFDLQVNGADNWYIQLEKAGRSYCVAVGLCAPGGQFHPLAFSKAVSTPPDVPCACCCEQWWNGERYLSAEEIPPAPSSLWQQLYQPLGEAAASHSSTRCELA